MRGREREGEGGRVEERVWNTSKIACMMLIQTLCTYSSCSNTGCSHNVPLLIGDLNPLTELMVPHQYRVESASCSCGSKRGVEKEGEKRRKREGAKKRSGREAGRGEEQRETWRGEMEGNRIRERGD